MNSNRNCKCFRHDRESVISLALVRYNFSTPDIRLLMRQVLGHAVSGRTIKRLVRSTGRRLKRGRPRSTPRIHKGDVNHLIELTSGGGESIKDNAFQLFQEVYDQFGLTPRQYLQWVTKSIRHGRSMLRRCLLCNEVFASLESSDRHCQSCRRDRRRLLNEERRSSFA